MDKVGYEKKVKNHCFKHCAYVSEINESFTFLNLFRFIYVGLYIDLNVEVGRGSMIKSLFFRYTIGFFHIQFATNLRSNHKKYYNLSWITTIKLL